MDEGALIGSVRGEGLVTVKCSTGTCLVFGDLGAGDLVDGGGRDDVRGSDYSAFVQVSVFVKMWVGHGHGHGRSEEISLHRWAMGW